MAFNVSDFRGQLEFGGARSSLFEVQIFNPVNAAGDLKTPFMVRAAQLPGATVGTVPISYFGRQIKVAGNRTFDAWTVTIINDEDFLIRNAIEEWNNQINTYEGNLRATGDNPSSYKSTAVVNQFSKGGEVLRTYEFDGLWCSDIAPIDLSWDVEGIQEYAVTFQYDYWRVQGGSTGNAGGV
jgi:hypothetical protein